ncbi:MAG: hypothetical protein SOW84_04910, partial [Candidatus Faecousia sp.]|nr:hypothetical protein [Candidatus Faecousia sp.]
FNSFRPESRQNALSSLLGVSPAASSAFSGTIHSRKAFKAFNQELVLRGLPRIEVAFCKRMDAITGNRKPQSFIKSVVQFQFMCYDSIGCGLKLQMTHIKG